MPGISNEKYAALAESFREHPGKYSVAARAAGCDPVTAKRMWLVGCRRTKRPPINTLVADIETHARARLEQAKHMAASRATLSMAKTEGVDNILAQADASESRFQEGQLIRTGRSAAMELLQSLVNTGRHIAKLDGKIARAVARLDESEEDLTLGQVVSVAKLLKELATSLRAVNEGASEIMRMERLLLGEPTSHVQVHHLHEVGLAEAEQRIAAAQSALARAKGAQQVVDAEVVPPAPAPPTEAAPAPAPAATPDAQ